MQKKLKRILISFVYFFITRSGTNYNCRLPPSQSVLLYRPMSTCGSLNSFRSASDIIHPVIFFNLDKRTNPLYPSLVRHIVHAPYFCQLTIFLSSSSLPYLGRPVPIPNILHLLLTIKSPCEACLVFYFVSVFLSSMRRSSPSFSIYKRSSLTKVNVS